MKQLMLSVKGGQAWVAEVPSPAVRPGTVLVRTAASLVSPGTERMAVEFGSKSLLGKALERPDLVRQVLDKARREGILTALGIVRSRLEQPLALGYSSAGTVIAVGEGVADIHAGDRVACAGAGYAVHAEVAVVPGQLAVPCPAGVDFESAAFTTLGAIALHSLRLAGIGLGEFVAVIGLGVVGLLAVQLAKAAGCRVLGMDPDQDRCQLAERLGCEGVAATPEQMKMLVSSRSSSRGADAVIITAATSSNEPLQVAGEIARDRAPVVCVGAVGMEVPRKLYYEKELTLRVSRAYGPGRYDPAYEEKGLDYPIGYVRWTEQRNMQAFVQLLDERKVEIQPLISHRFPIEESPKAYDLITDKREPCLGVLITYASSTDSQRSAVVLAQRVELQAGPIPFSEERRGGQLPRVAVGVFGAGNFARTTLLPAMRKVRGTECVGICTATGLSAQQAGKRFGFRYCTTDENALLKDPAIAAVVIATRHHHHARQIVAALAAEKHVYCEKPLCLTEDELCIIVRMVAAHPSRILAVGYNRRFAPMAAQLRTFFGEGSGPLTMLYRVNAGYVPPEEWVQDPQQGGGRVIGEMCHFVDFLTFLAGVLPVRLWARALPNEGRYRDDNVTITLEFANGSLGTVVYVASGDKSFSKERLEIFGGGSVAVLDDFRRLELVRDGRRNVHTSRLAQDKGHLNEWKAFLNAVQGTGSGPIPFREIVAASLTTFRIQEALLSDGPATIDADAFVASVCATDEQRPVEPVENRPRSS